MGTVKNLSAWIGENGNFYCGATIFESHQKKIALLTTHMHMQSLLEIAYVNNTKVGVDYDNDTGLNFISKVTLLDEF